MDAAHLVARLSRHVVHWKAYFSRTIRPFLAGDVLEVGCGMGDTSRLLCNEAVSSWTALEPDPELLEVFGRHVEAEGFPVPIELVVGTVESLPRVRPFDGILYIDVLEHIEDDREELRAAADRLRPGGVLIVLSPAHQFLYTPFDRVIGHFRRYSARGLSAIEPEGMTCEKLFYLDSVGMFASMANRLFLRQRMPTARQLRFWDSVLVRASVVVDWLTAYRLGKTVLGIWRRPS